MKSIKNLHIVGCIFSLAAGVLLHFLFEWSNNNLIVAAFSTVNESTWEHLKLVFVSIIFFAIVEYFWYGVGKDNFFTVKLISVLAGMLTVVTLFYTYAGVIGNNYSAVNIAIFVLGVIVNYVLSYVLIKNDKLKSKLWNNIALLALIFIAACFVYFTYRTPQINIFVDPITQAVGIDSAI